MTGRWSLWGLRLDLESSSKRRDSGSLSAGQIFKVSRPFFSISEAGIIDSGGMGRLAAAMKHFWFREWYEMICYRRTNPLTSRFSTIERMSKSPSLLTATCWFLKTVWKSVPSDSSSITNFSFGRYSYYESWDAIWLGPLCDWDLAKSNCFIFDRKSFMSGPSCSSSCAPVWAPPGKTRVYK